MPFKGMCFIQQLLLCRRPYLIVSKDAGKWEWTHSLILLTVLRCHWQWQVGLRLCRQLKFVKLFLNNLCWYKMCFLIVNNNDVISPLIWCILCLRTERKRKLFRGWCCYFLLLWIRIQTRMDPRWFWSAGSGSKRATISHKKSEEILCFDVLDVIFRGRNC